MEWLLVRLTRRARKKVVLDRREPVLVAILASVGRHESSGAWVSLGRSAVMSDRLAGTHPRPPQRAGPPSVRRCGAREAGEPSANPPCCALQRCATPVCPGK